LSEGRGVDEDGGELGVVALTVPLEGGVGHAYIRVGCLGHVDHGPGDGLVGLALLLSEGGVGRLRRVGKASGQRGCLGPPAFADGGLILTTTLVVASERVAPGAYGDHIRVRADLIVATSALAGDVSEHGLISGHSLIVGND
jgi:hypothetical protein